MQNNVSVQNAASNPQILKSMSKNSSPQSPVVRYAFKAITIHDPHNSTTTSNRYCYRLTPLGLGNIDTIRAKFQLIAGNIWVTNKDGSRDLHPMFKYIIQKKVLCQFTGIKNAPDAYTSLQNQIGRHTDGSDAQEKISQFIRNTKNKFAAQTEDSEKYASRGKSRVESLKACQLLLASLRRERQAQFLQLLKSKDGKKIKTLYPQDHSVGQPTISSYNLQEILAVSMCDNIDALSVAGKSQQIIKLQLFIKDHAKYYLTVKSDQNDQAGFDFNISKPSKEPERVLHTIQNHVYLRKVCQTQEERKSMEGVNVQLIKDIVTSLKVYEIEVSTETERRFYTFVNPQNVIFDQNTLRPKLRFQPLLEQALGLYQKPLTFENRVIYYPTPQGFNFFQSLREVHQDTKQAVRLILKDQTYGRQQVYKDQRQELSAGEKANLQEQRRQLQKLQQHRLLWQVRLISYYIRYGRQYGSNKKLTDIHSIELYFKTELEKAQKLFENKQNWYEFFGHKSSKLHYPQVKEEQEVSQTFDQLLDYLQIKDKDEHLQNLKFQRKKVYHNYRSFLLREIVRQISGDGILPKLYNVKKYICMFVILSCEVIEQINSLIQIQIQKQGERSQLKDSLDRDVKRLRHDKTYRQFLESTYDRILGYKKRDARTDHQAYYINQDKQGVEHFQSIEELRKLMDIFDRLDQKLHSYEVQLKESSSKEETLLLQEKHKLRMSNMQTLMEVNYWPAKCLCRKIAKKQLQPKNPLAHHKIPRDQQGPIEKKAYILFDKKLQTLVDALFLFEPGKIIEYESLIVPLFGIEDSDKKPQIKKIRTLEEEKKVDKTMKNIQAIDQLLNLDVNPQWEGPTDLNLQTDILFKPQGYARQVQYEIRSNKSKDSYIIGTELN